LERRKIVLIGAGSAVFTQGLVTDFIVSKNIGRWEIALVDIDEKALQSITTLAKKMVEMKNADIIISSSTNRRELLLGADVVVTTIAVGGRRAWENDVFIPRKYGVYQPVGDTTMPGGISRALRMIPTMLEIARDVKELCPDAYFFNYSNPMTAICTAIKREVGIPVIGLCHGVIHVEQYLAKFLGVPSSEFKTFGVGLNHLTFLYDLRIKGKDAKPLLLEKLTKQRGLSIPPVNSNLEQFREMGGNDSDTPFYGDNPFSWHFFEKYNVFPAVLDRHVVEFFPERFPKGYYYGKTLGKDAFSFEKVIEYGDHVYEMMHEQAINGSINESLFNRSEGEHEQLVDILNSLYSDYRKIYSINIPNQGAVPSLPYDAVLEMPAIASAKGFIPLFINDLPEIPNSLLQSRITVVNLTVEAALTGDFSMFVEALLLDGSVNTEEAAASLAKELIEAHREFLPQFRSTEMYSK